MKQDTMIDGNDVDTHLGTIPVFIGFMARIQGEIGQTPTEKIDILTSQFLEFIRNIPDEDQNICIGEILDFYEWAYESGK